MTPIAWKMPELMMVNFFSGDPRSSGGTCGPSIMTDNTIINIPMRAKPDARASLEMSRYKDSGYDMQAVQIVIIKLRDARKPKNDPWSPGKIDLMTWGMVSPKQL